MIVQAQFGIYQFHHLHNQSSREKQQQNLVDKKYKQLDLSSYEQSQPDMDHKKSYQ
jgi:hypothetical protein